MPVSITRVSAADGIDDLVEFLCADEWPFHGTNRLTPAAAASIDFDSDDTATYWIASEGRRIGLVRLLDLGDVDDGSVQFDLRIASDQRGHGVGRQVLRWLTDHLFSTYPSLHRVEANTRQDNLAMQRVLELHGYCLEGRMRETWPGDDGVRHDTMVYGYLRWEWNADRSARSTDVVFRTVDATSNEAVWALTQYFGELDRRFSGGFDTASAMAEAPESLNPPSGLFVVALAGDDVVACGGIQWFDEVTAEIKRMWVDSTRRGMGLGKRLLGHLETVAQSAGRLRVVLDTNETLGEAISMYRALGYHDIERYNDNPYAHHWFAKKLLDGSR